MGLVTDVFHYIIMLNNQERKKQESQHASTDSTSEAATPPLATTATPAADPPSTVATRKIEHKSQITQDVVQDISAMKIDTSEKSFDDIANTIKAKYEQKNLKVPAIVLLSSMVAFASSVFFFVTAPIMLDYLNAF